ncbi:MAG TPA: M28 family metallopeptidase [Pyrinomonadaceae bacterium]|jgi:Zn-dependent M28 family amino/carboxypeptidase
MSFKAAPLASVLLLTMLVSPPTSARPGRAGKGPASAGRPGAATPFSGQRAYEHVRRLVEFGPRPSGSQSLERARRYILEQVGGTLEAWVADTPAGKVKMANIVVEYPGRTADTIVIASHYDTKRFKEFAFVGANDGGSSTGALIELARALRASEGKRRFTYRLVFFDGEEAVCRAWDECGKPGAPDNTYGSRHHVERLKSSDRLKDVRALILLDMMGYERLELGRDDMSTPWLLDVIWRTARELGYRQFVERAEGVGGDDHEPFLRAGVPSADLIQLGSYPYWHTAEDTLDKIAPASLKAVGDTVLASLPRIEEKIRAEGGRVKAGGAKR